MTDFQELSSFIQVVKAGGFMQASRQFGTPKSTLSRHVLTLEQRLGATLLHRSTRKIKLTSLGEAYFKRTVSLLKDLEEAETELKTEQGSMAGVIRITAPVDLGSHVLAEPIAKFSKLHPQVSFDILLTDRIVDLIGEQVDLAVRAGQLQDSNFKSRKLFIETMRLIASPDYLEKNGRPKEPTDLVNYQCLLFAPRAEFLTWHLANRKINVIVTPIPKFKVTNLAMCIELVKQGLGIALVPAFMLQDSIITGELELVLPEWKTEHRPMSLIWPQQSEPPRRVRMFIEFLTRELAQK
jgi:DNA-binding transcriptional LysR family regulator